MYASSDIIEDISIGEHYTKRNISQRAIKGKQVTEENNEDNEGKKLQLNLFSGIF